MGFRLSKDEDIVAYYLHRKLHKAHTWETIFRFRPDHPFGDVDILADEQYPCYYIDSTFTSDKLRSLNYRLVAEDRSGNVTYSDVKVVRPYDDGIRGLINEPLAYGVQCDILYDFTSGSGSGSGGSGTGVNGTTIGSGGSTSDAMPCTLIRWSYISDYPETLINFKVYRLDMSMAPNYPLTQGANPEPPYILVKTISPERANDDALQLGFPDNEYVHVDENATDPRGPVIKYKVIAQHRDGGSSEWSEEILVR